ncbi:MAG: Ribose-5-phosphate isomerase B [Candidatus Woesebacteria bacterium GW2011_GWA1_40_43]|uniref:Ribose-5-phosphate isomerase B n=1 Tax=Candidatus Woesebacteria bacterium GW2011_GWA1_40_43 TaxID=1618553 RepID=A0A0G0UV57_9BACT|nr:MAG: Ribose-5-phosphate isomerase B [Candidatus Woesebacteria bacterium GW2011_GWD2_40_19]KKR57088.1 MAG: Ribose-5-phosphate isomerase B [Candidatus Woesebacteria bacterium GW2011_GWC2_40_30]KKR63535.1 MAG: Ribose-5-phosphate isomerase B [Candidatus Woesebacteria bacterium GW2011_GWA1_40_43]
MIRKLDKKVFVGSDHAGFGLKKKVLKYLSNKNIKHEDVGPHKYDGSDDYPDYGFRVAEKVSKGFGEGILICMMSGGMTIVANKVKGVRALPCTTIKESKFARIHNNANVIILAALKFKNQQKLHGVLDTWFNTKWSEVERHSRRLKKISDYENKHFK